MWLCMNDGFVSVVKDRLDPKGKTLLVRARKREHLKAFLGRKGKAATIYEDPLADYRWRAKVPRSTLVAIMASRIDTLEYDNFKGSVKDKELHDMYLGWWVDHNRMQEKEYPPKSFLRGPVARRQRQLWPSPALDPVMAKYYDEWLKDKDLFNS